MQNVYTVGQVNRYVKSKFTEDYMLNRIYIKGEVSNCKYHTSGHIYFSLKDESGVIACVMFAGSRSGLSFRMRDGQKIIGLGSVSIYEKDGKYQFYVKEAVLEGAGLLYEKFEALKKELEEMGMFSAEYKRPIPRYVQRVGIVTAKTGAALRDMIHISHRRNPYVQLILYPAQVQGEGATQSIIRGIRLFQKQKVDVMIVGRGGGSIEDLWAFNEESVARAIFESEIPVISAVGHETDVLISDYVADLRAPTPSAAAELAVYEYSVFQSRLREYREYLQKELLYKLRLKREQCIQTGDKLRLLHPRQKLLQKQQFSDELMERMTRSLLHKIQTDRELLVRYQMRLKAYHPEKQVLEKRQTAERIREKLNRQMRYQIEKNRHKMSVFIEKMKGLSPLEKLNQGYAYVEDGNGQVLSSVSQTEKGHTVAIYVKDGKITAEVKEIHLGGMI